MTAVAGTAYYKINGTQYSLRGNVRASLGNRRRESIVGLDQYHGYKEIPEVSYIEVELTDRPDMDLNILESLTDQTIHLEQINGKFGVLRNAAQVNKLELNVDDGVVTVRFEGPTGEWITA